MSARPVSDSELAALLAFLADSGQDISMLELDPGHDCQGDEDDEYEDNAELRAALMNWVGAGMPVSFDAWLEAVTHDEDTDTTERLTTP